MRFPIVEASWGGAGAPGRVARCPGPVGDPTTFAEWVGAGGLGLVLRRRDVIRGGGVVRRTVMDIVNPGGVSWGAGVGVWVVVAPSRAVRRDWGAGAVRVRVTGVTGTGPVRLRCGERWVEAVRATGDAPARLHVGCGCGPDLDTGPHQSTTVAVL